MDYVYWIALYAISCLFVAWVIFGSGADWLEGSFLSIFFVHSRAPRWTAEGIKWYVGLAWCGETVWFFIGLFSRPVRHFFIR